jgi:hypothetical protein
MAAFITAITYLTNYWGQQHPEIAELRSFLLYTDWKLNRPNARGDEATKQPSPAVEREALETYIAGKFRPIITDRKIWNGFTCLTIPQPHRKLAERIIAERPAPSAAELAQAVSKLKPILNEAAQFTDAAQTFSPAAIGSTQFVGIWLIFVALPGLIAAAVFRRGLVMLAFGVDCVTRSGALASRPRMLWRTIVFNVPVLSAPLVVALVFPLVRELVPSLLAVLAALALLTVWSSLLPTRGLTDRLSGTYPVPR